MRRWLVGIAFVLTFAAQAAAGEPKVIILGFDGMDPALTQTFMDEGLMPNLVRLAQKGHYSVLKTSNPSESPVAWSVFSVGANPAKTGIYDFLRRMPGSYYPEFATVTPSKKAVLPSDAARWGIGLGAGVIVFVLVFLLAKLVAKKLPVRLGTAVVAGVIVAAGALYVVLNWVPKSMPLPISNRMGKNFWEITAEAGLPSTAIRMPVTFPVAEVPNTRLLSGLGVPDVRQTNGTYTLYSTEKASGDTEMGGRLVPVTVMGDRVEGRVLGPKNFTLEGKPGIKTPPDAAVPFVVNINRAEGTADITVQGETRTLKTGEFSEFFEFKFELNPILSLYGVAKFALLSIEPEFRLYLTPVNFDPAHMPPTVRISNPTDFSAQLAKRHGLFKTIGWQEETWALNELVIDEDLFLSDLYDVMRRIENIITGELEKDDWRLFIGVFEATDRLQHMMWRHWDDRHPLHDNAEAARYSPEFGKLYAEVDRIVGNVMDKYVDDDTHLIVMSDHGFQSFRKAININTWLVHNGFMTLKGQDAVRDRNLDDLFGKGEFWPNVDWSRTKAYHLGLGQMYINLFDREPEGAVMKTEYEAVQNELKEKLLQLTDPEDGRPVFVGVYRRQDIYRGPAYDFAPDLILGFNEGFRISWQSALGGIPKGVFADNDRKWSGDHCSVDPSLTGGVVFSNQRFEKADPSIMDIAPTVLKVFGLPENKEMEGKPLY